MRMSLDIAVGLAWFLGRELVLDGLRPIATKTSLATGTGPNVLDLYDVPIPLMDPAVLDDMGFSREACTTLDWPPAVDCVFCHPNSRAFSDDTVANFRNGRPMLINSDELQNHASPGLQLGSRMLSTYCYFFLSAVPERAQMIELFKRVAVKSDYRRFADQLVARLGVYDAVHLRRGDLIKDAYVARGYDGVSVANHLQRVIDSHSVLVITTDGSREDREFFAPIERHFPNHIYLDHLIMGDKKLLAGFVELPHHDEAPLALVSQMVAADARTFVGTLFSTFTGLVHRERGLRGSHDDRFLYANNPFGDAVRYQDCEFKCAEKDTPTMPGTLYSWNRIAYPLPYRVYPWFREWQESYR